MKFVHMADMHFDAPFTVLNTRSDGKLGEKRRLEQREILKKIIDYIKENKIEYLFIAGDLYENEYIRESTIIYINNLFKEIQETKIYITPGNHDPYIQDSMYRKFKWSENVKIFGSQIEKVETEEVDIYGFGFQDFYCKDSDVENIKIQNVDKINVLITHGSLAGGTTEDLEYNPLNKNKLKEIGFDYVALGHIHMPDNCSDEQNRILYSGSTMALGFDELGKHGVIVGEISKSGLKKELLVLDSKEFKEIELDISNVISEEELIEKINEIEIDDNIFYKIILVGKRNFEVNLYNLYEFINSQNIIKVKNETVINIDVEKLSQESSLMGIFIKNILEDVKSEKLKEEVAEEIIEIGLNILEKNK